MFSIAQGCGLQFDLKCILKFLKLGCYLRMLCSSVISWPFIYPAETRRLSYFWFLVRYFWELIVHTTISVHPNVYLRCTCLHKILLISFIYLVARLVLHYHHKSYFYSYISQVSFCWQFLLYPIYGCDVTKLVYPGSFLRYSYTICDDIFYIDYPLCGFYLWIVPFESHWPYFSLN